MRYHYNNIGETDCIKHSDSLSHITISICQIVLYCFDEEVIAAQCTATFLRSIVLPRIKVLLGHECAD